MVVPDVRGVERGHIQPRSVEHRVGGSEERVSLRNVKRRSSSPKPHRVQFRQTVGLDQVRVAPRKANDGADLVHGEIQIREHVRLEDRSRHGLVVHQDAASKSGSAHDYLGHVVLKVRGIVPL